MRQPEFDVAIVGAGPIGIELAVALKEAGISFIQFDKGQVAETIFQYPPETRFFSSADKISIVGIPIQTVDQQKCSKEGYLAYLRSIVLKYNLPINTHEDVHTINKDEDGHYILSTESAKGKLSYRVRYVVLATGGLSEPRMLGVTGEGLPHVMNSLGDPHRYFRKSVVIVGGKNSAAEAALRCFHAGAKVTLIIRKNAFDDHDVKYWLLPELKSRIRKGEIECYHASEVTSIHRDCVILKNNDTNEEVRVQADFVIKAIGFLSDNRLYYQLSIPFDPSTGRPEYDKETMEAPCKNVFVLGTAIAGTQKRFRVYIENTHHHVTKICRTLCHRLNIEFPSSEWLIRLPEPDDLMKKFLEE